MQVDDFALDMELIARSRRGGPGDLTASNTLQTILDKYKNLKRLVDEINARPASQKAGTLKDRHKFKTEMDQEALHAMFPHMKDKVA